MRTDTHKRCNDSESFLRQKLARRSCELNNREDFKKSCKVATFLSDEANFIER